MARTFAITYGSYIVGLSGTDSEVRLTDKISMDQSYDEVVVSFEVILLGTSVANFHTVEGDLIAAFTKPDQDLTIAIGGATRYTFSQASNTGFNAQPRIEKLGGVEDTDRSSRYKITIAFGLPADLSGKSGRQSSSVSVSYDPSGIATVQISGVYTGLSSNSARAQFAAAIATYVAAVKSDLGIPTWELVERPREVADDNDKTLAFSRTYRQIIQGQSTSGGDHASIVQPSLSFTRVESATNDTTELGQTEPLVAISATYSCAVDHNQTTDLDSLYTDTIRPHILAEAASLVSGPLIVTREEFRPNLDRNTVAVTIRMQVDGGTGLYHATVETQDILSSGETRYVVWDGNPFSRDVYQGPQTTLMRRRKSVLQRKDSGPKLWSGPPPSYRENSLVRKSSRRTVGRNTNATLELELVVLSQEFERVHTTNTATAPTGSLGAELEANDQSITDLIDLLNA